MLKWTRVDEQLRKELWQKQASEWNTYSKEKRCTCVEPMCGQTYNIPLVYVHIPRNTLVCLDFVYVPALTIKCHH